MCRMWFDIVFRDKDVVWMAAYVAEKALRYRIVSVLFAVLHEDQKIMATAIEISSDSLNL